MKHGIAWVGVVMLLSLLAFPVRAEDAERPWARGAPPSQQQAALHAFEAGNALFTESQYAAALVRYREAIKLWNHPAVHYNAAVSLINLDQPLAAYDHLEAALAYGEAPLGEDNHRQAQLYKKLLSAQLGELEIRCEEPGALVMLDGETLFRAPGKMKRRIMPGAHQLVARKAGFLTETRALQVPSGTLTHEKIALERIGVVRMRTVHRWPTWTPWAVLGGGAAIGLVGIPLMLEARSNFNTFDSEIAKLCPRGCSDAELPKTVREANGRGRVQNTVALTLFSTGAAVAATGLVLLFLNQPRLEADTPRASLTVHPLVDASTFGVSTSYRF